MGRDLAGYTNSFDSVNNMRNLIHTTNKETQVRRQSPEGSRLESIDTIKSKFKSVPFKEFIESDVGGIPLFYEGDLAYVSPEEGHALVIGSTGSRKTRCVVAPTIKILAKAGESIVVTDPKGELLDFTHSDLMKYNYEVNVLDFRSLSSNISWNPLTIPYNLIKSGDKYMENEGKLMLLRLASDMIPLIYDEDPYWVTSAQSLLYGMMLCVINNSRSAAEATIYNVVMNVAKVFATDETLCDFVKTLKVKSPEYVPLMTVINNAISTRRCILSVFNQNMSLYVHDNCIVDMLSDNTIDFDSVGTRKTALFLILPDENPSTYPLVVMFLSQLYGALIKKAQSMEGVKKLPVRVNYILDEFASLPKMNSMVNMIAAARGRNIRFVLAIQDMAQLAYRYGEDGKTIASNCANWVYLYCRQMDFLRELSEIVGCDRNGNPLISTNGLMNLDIGEALIICGRMRPFRSRLMDISEYPESDCHYLVEKRDVKNPVVMDLLARCKRKNDSPNDFKF